MTGRSRLLLLCAALVLPVAAPAGPAGAFPRAPTVAPEEAGQEAPASGGEEQAAPGRDEEPAPAPAGPEEAPPAGARAAPAAPGAAPRQPGTERIFRWYGDDGRIHFGTWEEAPKERIYASPAWVRVGEFLRRQAGLPVTIPTPSSMMVPPGQNREEALARLVGTLRLQQGGGGAGEPKDAVEEEIPPSLLVDEEVPIPVDLGILSEPDP